jgi:hypothetical protein
MMTHRETWKVIRVTERGQRAHVELGHRPGSVSGGPTWGPAFVVPHVSNAPHVGDEVDLTFSWDER